MRVALAAFGIVALWAAVTWAVVDIVCRAVVCE